MNVWNGLPADVVTASTVRAFKNKLETRLTISLDGRQSNRNRTHRSCVFTYVSLDFLHTYVKTAYLIGYSDMSHCP